jgi:hypothetical protein
VDAFATPFVQGQLRKQKLMGVITSSCPCCGERIEIEIDSDLKHRVLTEKAHPVISAPLVNFKKLKDPSIIDSF